MRGSIKKTYISLSFLLFTTLIKAQQLYLPHAAYDGIESMNRHIPALAATLIERYRQNPLPNKIVYYGNLLRYQIIAGRYKEGLQSIAAGKAQFSTADSLEAQTNVFPFALYANAMYLATVNGHNSFNQLFDSVFSAGYEALSFKAADKAENYFKASLQDRQQRFLDQTAKLKRIGKDSISYAEAQALCFSYLNYVVYGFELPKTTALMDAVNRRKYIIEDSVMIPMRDGAKISATIVRNRTTTGPQPVVLKFGIYANPSEVPETKFIAGHGYIGVIADTRGKGLSRDPITPFEHDANDGYDIIDWISKQSWCNGKIGMYGGSYLGFSQWATTKKMHPNLKTIVPIAAVGTGIDFPGMSGIYGTTEILSWLHFIGDNRYTVHNYSAAHWDSVQQVWYSKGLAFEKLDSVHGKYNPLFHQYIQHPSYDRFWQNTTPYKTDFANINIPVLTISGYYDDDQKGALYYFNQHHTYNKNANHYVLLGPYDHGGVQGYPFDPAINLNDYLIDSCARINIMDLVFEWFDHVLKGRDRPALLKDRINFQVMGTNSWRHVPAMDKMNNDTLLLHLTDKSNGKYFSLEKTASNKSKSIEQRIDLKDRSDALTVEDFAINGGDFSIVDSMLNTNNHIVFASNAVNNAFDINGSFEVNLNLITNKKDFDLSVRLYQQTPDGKFFQLSNNIARSSYINDVSKRNLLIPGRQQQIRLSNTFFSSRHIAAGSRLVLLVGVNKSPVWQINYGTGKDVSKETAADAGEPLKIQWMTNGSIVKIPVWDM